MSGVAKHLARQSVYFCPPNIFHIFSSTMFLTVDSSATALAAFCLLLTCLPQKHLAVSSAIEVQTKWCDFIDCTTAHFNNLFLHRLCKLHYIQPSRGQAVANSALGSKSLASPVLCHKSTTIAMRSRCGSMNS